MKKYEEKHYFFENIKDRIYPWVKKELKDYEALNGKFVSEKETPMVAFVGDLFIIFVIRRGEDSYEIITENTDVVKDIRNSVKCLLFYPSKFINKLDERINLSRLLLKKGGSV